MFLKLPHLVVKGTFLKKVHVCALGKRALKYLHSPLKGEEIQFEHLISKNRATFAPRAGTEPQRSPSAVSSRQAF